MAIESAPNRDVDTSSSSAGNAELVHEARKTIKRMRALARLLRHELGEAEFERVSGSLRDAGRSLAGARDAEVRLATLERLSKRHPKALSSEPLDQLLERLGREREQTRTPTSPHEVLLRIAEMRRDLARWNLVAPDLEALAPGLQQIYREGRQRYARVKREHGRHPEHLHDWRKRVKALYYALDMLGASHAKGARRAARRADRLGELLGEDHDLWMLATHIECQALGQSDGAHRALLELIARRRKRLRRHALALGAKLYRRKPARFVARVGRALSR